MRRLNSPTHAPRVPPRGLARALRFALVATPFLLALSTPPTPEAQKDSKDSERNRAPDARCPSISLCCHAALHKGLLGPFTATLGETGGVKPALNWKVSAGQVAEGQGTTEILVGTKGLKGGAVLVTLEVGGYG